MLCDNKSIETNEIEVDGITVGVNRGILAARCQFFHCLFKNADGSPVKMDRPKYRMSDLVPNVRIGYEVLMVILNYLYTGKIKDFPTAVSTCVDESCAHDACGPAIDCTVQLTYACVNFQIEELVVAVQRRLLSLVHKASADEVIPILLVAFHCALKQLLTLCVQRTAQSNLDNMIMEKELPHNVLSDIKSLRSESKQGESHESTQENSVNEKNIRRLHKALDSGDIELVKLLLGESDVTLDAACALHYAAAYCYPKTVFGLLNLKKADVNLRNSRGYTVLHVAARRKDPLIAIELLEHGASVFDTTLDGLTSLTICRRLTRPKDFTQEKKHGLNANTDRLCIDMLERKMCSNPPSRNIVPESATMAAYGLRMGLLLLENRVAMARVLFPSQAKLAMQVAKADSTMEFPGLLAFEDSHGHFGEFDFNETETSSELFVKLQQRLHALERTVAAGRCYFPNCSEVLDRLSDDDTLGTLLLDEGTPEERRMKAARYMELRRDVVIALTKDKAEHRRARAGGVSSCSSTS
ncbi:BTB/POZ domain and ankyrin repeat-containing protein NPR1-like isoform X2 [Henckelia pumila]|uniref:BTB/POZ domain and ankyrin repeat-containing protein NPR1-like isoform X2 n=1 Tax=Henckelia pumila TaxID=405737 RepID=UPI003C6E4A3A